VTLDCRGYRTQSLREIPLASQYRNASLTRGKLRIPRRSTLLLMVTISKTSKVSYDWSHVRVRAFTRHSPIFVSDDTNVGIVFNACICNRRRGRLLFEQAVQDSTEIGGAV